MKPGANETCKKLRCAHRDGVSAHCSHVSVFAQVRAVRTGASGSLSSVRNGGEGWGEEALRTGDTVRMGGAPLSPTLSPFVPHGAREPDALLVAAIAAHTFATIASPCLPPNAGARGQGRSRGGRCQPSRMVSTPSAGGPAATGSAARRWERSGPRGSAALPGRDALPRVRDLSPSPARENKIGKQLTNQPMTRKIVTTYSIILHGRHTLDLSTSRPLAVGRQEPEVRSQAAIPFRVSARVVKDREALSGSLTAIRPRLVSNFP